MFVFFGLVAVLGTTYTQAGELSWPAWVGAVCVGMLACALLMANNLRDVPTDALVGKRTLAVRMGERWSRRAYAVLVVGPGAARRDRLRVRVAVDADRPAAPGARRSSWPSPCCSARAGRALVPVLAGTGLLELAFGVLLGLGLAL